MKKLLRNVFGPSIFTSFLILACFGSAFAQGGPATWQRVMQGFHGTIHIVKFLDAVGAPKVGFVGDDTGIWRTNDGGTTWTRCTITSPNPGPLPPFQTGWVNDITFKDALNGFAIIDSNTNPLDSGIIITADSGKTWVFDDNIGTPDSGDGIYYNHLSNLLFVASDDKGFMVSSNAGQAWQVLDTHKYYTGFAFIDDKSGVLATEGSNCLGSPFNYWLQTTDEGQTWHQSRMFYESWQPLGISTTTTFFTSVNPNDCANSCPEAVFRSDMNGYAFGPIPNAFTCGDSLTEDMVGDGCVLFAPSSQSHLGMFVSTDDGKTWQPLQGGAITPTPTKDTRIYASPSIVWTFSGNQLYYLTRPATTDFHIWPDTVRFTNAGCAKISDTTVHIFACNCGSNPVLTGDSTSRFTTIVDTFKGVISNPLPLTLCTSGTSPEGNPVSVDVQFQPTSINTDSGFIHFHLVDNGQPVDTSIFVVGNGVSPHIQPLVPGRIVITSAACGEVDTSFQICNTSCTCIQIVSCSTDETSQDQCFLEMIGCNEISPQNPIILQPGDCWNFPVTYIAGIRKTQGVFHQARVSLNWETCVPPYTTGTTPDIVVEAATTTDQTPRAFGFKVTGPDCCSLKSSVQYAFFQNLTCDTLTLQQPQLISAGTCNTMHIDSAGSIPPLHFPIVFPPQALLKIPVTVTCDNCTENLTFPYTFGTTGGDCDQTFSGDTTVQLIVDIGNTSVIQPAYSPATLNFGNVSCCDTSQTRTIKITGKCILDTLKSITLSNKHFEVIGTSLGPKNSLGIDANATITIRFIPDTTCSGDSIYTGILTLVWSSAESTSQQITLKGTSTIAIAIAPDSTGIDFGTLRYCDSTCQTIMLKNSACHTQGSVAQIVGPTNGAAFKVVSPAVGTAIAAGDSIPVTICKQPSTDTGAVTDAVTIIFTDPAGDQQPAVITLTANVNPPSLSYTVTQLASDTLCDTATLDEQFTVTNTSTCYTYVIKSASVSGPDVSVTSPSLPVTIAGGANQSFGVHFAPTKGSGDLTGTITLTDTGGNTIVVPYDIPVKSCVQTIGTFTLAMPGSIIATPNCTNGNVAFTAQAGGGAGTITGVSLSGSPQFSLTTSSGGPMPFNDTVVFDPNTSGNNSTTLTISYTINGTAGDTVITIKGMVTGSKYSARIGVTTPSTACLSPNDSDLKEFDVTLYDSIPAGLGLNQITFVIHYHGDLLWNPSGYNFGSGWSLTSLTPESDGLHVTLKYTGNGTPSGTPLIRLKELAAISNIVSDTAHVTDPHFNDSAFEACVMSAFAAGGDSNAAPICVDTNLCPDNLIARAMQGNLRPITAIQVVPNPAHKDGSAATLHFTTNIDAPVTSEVLDMLGRPVAQIWNGPLEKGDHTLQVATDNIPEGVYFVRMNVGGYTVIRKFVIEKE